MRALLKTTSHFCHAVVLKLRTRAGVGDMYKLKIERLKLGLRKTVAAVVPGPDADAMIWQALSLPRRDKTELETF